jgi:uncharacterized membrane protein
MSWNPNPGQQQDPNSQYGQYGGYNPNQPSQPPDPYSGQQSAHGQYGPQSGYNPNQSSQPPDPYSGQQSAYGQYGQQSGYNPPSGQPGNYGQYGQPGGYQQPYGTGAPASAGAAASGPSTLGLDPNIAAFLSYLFSPISALIIFLMEKQNRFVRFHAMQALLSAATVIVIEVVLSVLNHIPFVDILSVFLLGPLVGLAIFVIWIVLMVNAFQGKYFKLPVIGDYAEKYSNQGM